MKIINCRTIKLTKFFDNNQFEILVDNPEEGINDIIARTVILRTPKHCLKKCKRCNFKKRTCVIDSYSCKVIQQNCLKCNKKGHFPQSPYCKAQKRSKATKETKLKKERIITKILDKNILELVAIKIDQLEIVSKKKLPGYISEESDSCYMRY